MLVISRPSSESRPSRDAWIETAHYYAQSNYAKGRALRGTRGLKHFHLDKLRYDLRSRPSRDAWIETDVPAIIAGARIESRPSRDAWIETAAFDEIKKALKGRALRGTRGLKRVMPQNIAKSLMSRPSRDAWIETFDGDYEKAYKLVAPFAGRVD